MKKIYVSPSANRKSGYPNRYFLFLKDNLAEWFDVLDADNKPYLTQGWALLKHSFRADIFLLSFVETIAFHRLAFVQYLMVRLSFLIMRLRRGRVVFIFHNPRPHKGENWMSRSLTKVQLKQSCLVVAHSCETASIARGLLSEYGCSPDKVRYICHPVAGTADGGLRDNVVSGGQSAVSSGSGEASRPSRSDEILIWGNILPYKGVLEFVSSPAVRAAGLNVRIIGRCKDPGMASDIEKAAAECDSIELRGFNDGLPAMRSKIVFENRSADFDELADLVRSSRFVLFPYLPGSVSGSGVLMDTLAMGGTPVGPAVGAFADLAREGVCFVYGSEAEMIEILKSDRRVNPEVLSDFIARNSWRSYAKFFADFFTRPEDGRA